VRGGASVEDLGLHRGKSDNSNLRGLLMDRETQATHMGRQLADGFRET